MNGLNHDSEAAPARPIASEPASGDGRMTLSDVNQDAVTHLVRLLETASAYRGTELAKHLDRNFPAGSDVPLDHFVRQYSAWVLARHAGERDGSWKASFEAIGEFGRNPSNPQLLKAIGDYLETRGSQLV